MEQDKAEKLKTLLLKYAERDYRKMEAIKSIKGMGWEDFVFWAIINTREKRK